MPEEALGASYLRLNASIKEVKTYNEKHAYKNFMKFLYTSSSFGVGLTPGE